MNRTESDNTPVVPLPSQQMPAKKHSRKLLIMVIIFIVIAAAVVPAVKETQSLLSNAAVNKCRPIGRVQLNPGIINTFTDSKPTYISVLAFGADDKPIFTGVGYEWGMSSSNSIGTVKSKHDLATFFPVKPGIGDLYVRARNNCKSTFSRPNTQYVVGSIKVTVQQGEAPSATVKPVRKK